MKRWRRFLDGIALLGGAAITYVLLVNVNWTGPKPVPPQVATVVGHEFRASGEYASNWLLLRLENGDRARLRTTVLASPYAEGDRICVQGATRWIGRAPELWVVVDAKCAALSPAPAAY